MNLLLTSLYVAASYLRPAEIFPELAELRVMILLGIACALGGGISLVVSSQAWVRLPQSYLMLLFLFWIGISVALNGWPGGALVAWGEFSIPALVFFLILASVTSVRKLSILAGVLVICSLLLACAGIAAYHFGYKEDLFVLNQSSPDDGGDDAGTSPDPDAFRRIKSLGFLNDPNDLAQALVLALPLIVVRWKKQRFLRNVAIVLVPSAVLLYGIYLTFSRGAIIALGVLVFIAARDRWGTARAAILAAGGAAFVFASSFTAGRAVSVQEASAADRLDAWRTGLNLLHTNPIAGVGYNRFIEFNDLTAHNSYVLCFAELGFVGYFIWLGLLVTTLSQLNSLLESPLQPDDSTRVWIKALRNSLIAFLAGAFFLSRTYSQSLYVLLAMSAALYSFGRQNSSEPEGSSSVWVWRTAALEVTSIAAIYGFLVVSQTLAK